MRQRHFITKKFGTAIFLPTQEGFKRVRHQKRFAFHCESLTGFSIISHSFDLDEICDLNSIAFRDNELLGFVAPSHSPFKHFIASK